VPSRSTHSGIWFCCNSVSIHARRSRHSRTKRGFTEVAMFMPIKAIYAELAFPS
jgi:hypothetical protein